MNERTADSSARTILVAGTASHVGKSTVAAGLCRALADRGVAVAPFKAQNMSNNARVVVRPEATAGRGGESEDESGDHEEGEGVGDEWGEIGVSQFVQARAARVTPTTDTNPVLLKPHGDGESQLIVHGRAVGTFSAGSYYEEHWERARAAARESHARLERGTDVVVAEGAGSIAEINLHERDLANVETARFADAEILLLVDIERGGAFASLYGTLELLPADVRDRVVGALITKFRGDPSLLEPGIEAIEARTGVPILGVLPYDDPGLPAEDSVSLPGPGTRATTGADDGVPASQSVTVAVLRLPRISNATDLEVLAEEPGIRLEYVPVPEAATWVGSEDENRGSGGETNGESGNRAASGEARATTDEGSDEAKAALERADALVIPGTKNTVDDCRALRRSGLWEGVRTFDGPIVGLCGGYQLLGERLTNAPLEGTGETPDTVSGLGLLPVETRFEATKHVAQTTVTVEGAGIIAGASGQASGYEIHTGRTSALEGEPIARPLGVGSAARGNVLGTYLHGVFDNENVREAFLETVFARAGVERSRRRTVRDEGDGNGSRASVSGYDRAAALLERHAALGTLGGVFENW
ncbi:cobyric acid synthase [Natronobiforma cellulositropha]|uniref:cobyric acid synthase n=1 Tax=Natronobiforma cellulositropha TaxID=1679076 RepID=UPI0021D5773B|nr:cobyric acid synthase [Natronobiforma cellulositropha]